MSRHEQEIKDLTDILYAMELKYKGRETEAGQDFQSIMDELKNKVAPIQLTLMYSIVTWPHCRTLRTLMP